MCVATPRIIVLLHRLHISAIFANSRMCKNAKKCDKTFAAACDEYVEFSDCSDDEPELSDDE